MKKLITVFMLCLTTVSCNPIKPISDIEALGAMYIEYVSRRSFDKEWRKINIKNMFHPDISPLVGYSKGYKAIKYPNELEEGIYIFKAVKIIDIISANEEVLADDASGKLSKHEEDVRFIKLVYEIEGYISNPRKKYDKYNPPVEIVQYLVCIKDRKNGKFKILDLIPDSRVQFYTKDYILKNSKYFSHGLSELLK